MDSSDLAKYLKFYTNSKLLPLPGHHGIAFAARLMASPNLLMLDLSVRFLQWSKTTCRNAIYQYNTKSTFEHIEWQSFVGTQQLYSDRSRIVLQASLLPFYLSRTTNLNLSEKARSILVYGKKLMAVYLSVKFMRASAVSRQIENETADGSKLKTVATFRSSIERSKKLLDDV